MRRLYHGTRGIDLRRWLALVVASSALFFFAARARAQEHDAQAPAASALTSAAEPAPPPPEAPRARASSAPAPSAASTHGAAAPSSSAASAASAEVKVRDKTVYVFRAPRAGRSPTERARAANAAIEAILAHPEQLGDVRAEEAQGTATIYIGKTPVITLGTDDVDATGEASLTVLSAQVTTRLSDAVSNERKRSAIATTVFSFSLLVFSALIAFLLLGRASEVAARLRTSIVEKPEKVGGVRLGKVEFVSAGSARGVITIGLTVGYRLVQVAIVYGWLIFGLSLFDATKGYTERLTGTVVKPLSALAERIGGALPLVIVAAIFAFAVTALVRFLGLFFDSVVRGDTRIAWLPRDLARPTSVLLRGGIVVTALVLASPIITGESDGALSRAGLAALVALGLATTPLLASAAVGVTVVFGRRLKKGDQIEIAGRAGRIVELTLLDVRIEDGTLAEVRVPHLLGLVHVTRLHRHAPLSTLEVVVDASAPQAEVERALFEAARMQSSRGSVELLYLDEGGAHYRITSASMRNDVSLGKVVQDALSKIGVGLGRGRSSAARATTGGARETT
jgi:small-conductance mechanosensitive channel